MSNLNVSSIIANVVKANAANIIIDAISKSKYKSPIVPLKFLENMEIKNLFDLAVKESNMGNKWGGISLVVYFSNPLTEVLTILKNNSSELIDTAFGVLAANGFEYESEVYSFYNFEFPTVEMPLFGVQFAKTMFREDNDKKIVPYDMGYIFDILLGFKGQIPINTYELSSDGKTLIFGKI